MTPLLVLQTALSSLSANKLRAGLTLLGIVIGVAAVITLMSIGRGTQQQITSRIQSLGSNLLFVRPGSTQQGGVRQSQGSANSLSLADAYALRDSLYTPTVAAVAPEVSLSGQVVAGRVNISTQVYGVSPEYAAVRNFTVKSGQFINQAQLDSHALVVVLGSQVSQDLFGYRNPVGQSVRISGLEFQVIGVLASKGGTGFGNQDNLAMIPLTTAYYRLGGQRATDGGIRVQNINVQVLNETQIPAAIQQVGTLLR
ncbi:MAG: ABC transporter permease, partial [Armatimonadetes bacterium]|nr:ABC transporter permease [Armatimonadota bacterium]